MRIKMARVILTVAAFATVSSAFVSAGGQKPSDLAGTSWKLIKLQTDSEETLVPDDRTKYTITFGRDGRVTTRIDCNRASSTWKAVGSNELKFGSWSRTQTRCSSGSLHDKIVNEGGNVRTYSIKNGHLFLSGMAAGGFYELEPLTRSWR